MKFFYLVRILHLYQTQIFNSCTWDYTHVLNHAYLNSKPSKITTKFCPILLYTIIFVKGKISTYQQNFKYLFKKFDNMYLCFFVHCLKIFRFFSKIIVVKKTWEDLVKCSYYFYTNMLLCGNRKNWELYSNTLNTYYIIINNCTH